MLNVGILYTPECYRTRAHIDCMLTAFGARHRVYFYFIFILFICVLRVQISL